MGFAWSSLHEFPHTTNYDSDLREVLYYIRNLRKAYEEVVANIDALKDSFEDVLVEFAKFQGQVDELGNNYNNLLDKVEELQTKLNDVILEYELLKELYNNFVNLIDAKINNYDVNVILPRLAELEVWMREELDNIWKQLEEIQAWTMFDKLEGYERKTIDVIDNYFESERVHALTVAEYGEFGYTIEDYERWNITTKNYAILSRDWFNHWYWFDALNPYTATYTTQNNVNSWLVTNQLRTPSNNEYDELDLTVDEYTAKELTVLGYYDIIPKNTGGDAIVLNGNGLTVTEYRSMGY